MESPPDTATKTIFEWVCRPTLVDGELVETILSYMRGTFSSFAWINCDCLILFS